jgi:hypothetical protein
MKKFAYLILCDVGGPYLAESGKWEDEVFFAQKVYQSRYVAGFEHQPVGVSVLGMYFSGSFRVVVL